MRAAELSMYVAALRSGEVLVCATETQFGLLADGLSVGAVARVCAIKGRPASAPIALLLPDPNALSQVAVDVTEAAWDLARRHWPGPLTLLVRARPGLPAAVTQDGKVGVRVPGSSPAQAVVRAFGGPLTATSANRSGTPVVASSREAQQVLGAEVFAVVPGHAPGTAPSTIVDVAGVQPRLVRAGAITLALSR